MEGYNAPQIFTHGVEVEKKNGIAELRIDADVMRR